MPVTVLEGSEREKCVLALHQSTGSLKARCEWAPVLRCEPSTYLRVVTDGFNHCTTYISDAEHRTVAFQLSQSAGIVYKRGVGIRKDEEGNVSFNDALSTFYLRLYGVGPMVKDHSDNERGNPLPPLHGVCYIHHSSERTAHITA